MQVIRITLILIMLLLALAALTGCAVHQVTGGSGPKIAQENLKTIQPGDSTRQDVLRLLGPPIAVARWNTPVNVTYTASGGMETVSSDTFFELFLDKHELGKNHIVYFYANRMMKGTGTMVMFAMSSEASDVSNKLWLLIDNSTGMVLDMFLLEGDK